MHHFKEIKKMDNDKKQLNKMITKLKRAGFTPVYAEEARPCLPNSYKYDKWQEFLAWKPGKFFVTGDRCKKKSHGGWKAPTFKVEESDGKLPKGFRWRSKAEGAIYFAD